MKLAFVENMPARTFDGKPGIQFRLEVFRHQLGPLRTWAVTAWEMILVHSACQPQRKGGKKMRFKMLMVAFFVVLSVGCGPTGSTSQPTGSAGTPPGSAYLGKWIATFTNEGTKIPCGIDITRNGNSFLIALSRVPVPPETYVPPVCEGEFDGGIHIVARRKS